LDRLEIENWLAELVTLPRVLEGGFKSGLRNANSHRSGRDSA
jgi:hypothetical protein